MGHMEVLQLLSQPVTSIGECLFVPLKKEIGYLFRFRRNVEDLKSQAEILILKRNDVKKKVEIAVNTLEEPKEEVKEWIKRVEDTEGAARAVDEAARENKCCPSGCISRYTLSKKAAKRLVIVKLLQKQGADFSEVSFIPSPSCVEIMPSSDYVEDLESAKSAMEQVKEALEDDNVRTIGVYGMPGVGKTALMRRMNNIQSGRHFKKVIMTTVSRDIKLMKIQDEIAERLGLKLEADSNETLRANKLSRRLMGEKKVLIILDDVWENFNLHDVGIPQGDEHKDCKIMVTTRHQDVCRKMGIQIGIELKRLSHQDAWVLLQSKAGEVALSASLMPTAMEIAAECGGLPLAIVTLGSSLKEERDPNEWHNALTDLRSSMSPALGELMPLVIESLRFSYNHLKSEELKLCFLFCRMFPRNHDTSLFDLRVYGIGEGFLKVVEYLKEASIKLLVYVKRLKSSFLLEAGCTECSVKMHEIVRDMAIEVIKKDRKGFLVNPGKKLKELPGVEELKQLERISLVNSGIATSMLPPQLECPMLKTLLLQNNQTLCEIPDKFFDQTTSLRVLDMSDTPISTLPKSLLRLKDLRTLCLNRCHELREFFLLGGLSKLEILCLRGSGISVLPTELGRLVNLKLLDLSETESLSTVPPEVITRLLHLEELYMGNSFSGWEVESGDGSKAQLSEVASLAHLAVLEIHVQDPKCLSQNMICPTWTKLDKFCICVGKKYHQSRYQRSIQLNIINLVAEWVKLLLERAEDIQFVDCNNLMTLPLELLKRVHDLKQLRVSGCNELKEVFSSSDNNEEIHEAAVVLNNLETLLLDDLPSLTSIWKGTVPLGSFQCLKKLIVSSCHALTTLFSFSVAHELLQRLEVLEVSDCDKMEGIIGEDSMANNKKEVLNQLKVLRLHNLPSLVSVCKNGVFLDSMEYIYVRECQNLRRLPLGPNSAVNLKQIEASIDWFGRLEWEDDCVKSSLEPIIEDLREEGH